MPLYTGQIFLQSNNSCISLSLTLDSRARLNSTRHEMFSVKVMILDLRSFIDSSTKSRTMVSLVHDILPSNDARARKTQCTNACPFLKQQYATAMPRPPTRSKKPQQILISLHVVASALPELLPRRRRLARGAHVQAREPAQHVLVAHPVAVRLLREAAGAAC